MLSFSQSTARLPGVCSDGKEANKAIQGTNEDKSWHFYLLTNSLPAEELKSTPLEKLVALQHAGTSEAAAQEWCWRCWRAEKGCQGGQRGGRQKKLGQGDSHWETTWEKLHPQVHGNEEHPNVHPCVVPAAQAGTPGCSRVGHSQRLTSAAPVSWERSCAANEHMKGFISAPGTDTDCKIPGTGSSSISIPARPSAPQHKNHREMGLLHEISLLLLECL